MTMRPAPPRAGKAPSDSSRTLSGRVSLERDVAGHDLQRLADLAGDVVADLGGRLDVVEVAAAGRGHRLQEHLVEVVADAEGGGGHAPRAQLAGVARQLVAVGDALVGEAVREQQAAVDALLDERAGDLLAAGQPAAREVGHVAGLDAAQPLDGRGPGRRRRQRAGDERLHDVVVDDDGEAVVRRESADGLLDGLRREADLLAVHGARAVEHEGQVDRRAAAAAMGLRRRHVHDDEALAVPARPDEPAVLADGEWRASGSWCPPLPGVRDRGG